jgi:glyoxylase-like metal-dependent hydrolase (beta-lactamase superfamily II)
MTRPPLVADQGFVEVADRVWVARHSWLDVNVTVVGGDRGLVVVDTHASERAMREVLDALRRVTRAEVVGVVNTHAHFDHTFGNAVVRDQAPAARLLAHEEAAAKTVEAGEHAKALYVADPDDPHGEEVLATTIVPATETFSSVRALDLGDRVLELVHPGRGHTAGDLVVRVGDADVLLAGDLVEQSAPPSYGPDCYPLDWPGSLDLVVGLLTPASVVVPGHGDLVDQPFVQDQRSDVGTVAETVFDLASRSVPIDEALRHEEWPWPAERLEQAVRRGYDHVPRTARRLPLV